MNPQSAPLTTKRDQSRHRLARIHRGMLCAFDLVYCQFHHFLSFIRQKAEIEGALLFSYLRFLVDSFTRSGPTRIVTALAIVSIRLLVDSFLLFRYLAENTTKNISKTHKLTKAESRIESTRNCLLGWWAYRTETPKTG